MQDNGEDPLVDVDVLAVDTLKNVVIVGFSIVTACVLALLLVRVLLRPRQPASCA
jgi:hypothetical protein